MADLIAETFPRDITLSLNISKDLWPIMGDATQLHQVMLNLCVNSRDAMPHGGTIKIAAENGELKVADLALHFDAKPGRYVLLRIEDTGTGIPSRIVDKIFDPFFTTKPEGKGTGLGLSTVTAIVKSHGGFVTLASEPGRGTTFNIYLPAAADEAVVADPESARASAFGRKELILVVDDEASIREAIQKILERNNYEVRTAADGREALGVYLPNQDSIRLVLTDVMMPVMDGVALARALRTINPDLRIVATTGLDQEINRAELLEVGVSELLHKPWRLEDLLETVRRALAQPEK
jgi:CheY-like chemotaxis protein